MTNVRVILPALLALGLFACSDKENALKTELQAKVAALEAVSKEKDELISDVVENAKFIQSINTEIDRVRRLPAGTKVVAVKPDESPIAVAAYRDTVLAHIRELTTRLEKTEARLAAVREKSASTAAAAATGSAKDVANATASMQQQLESYRETIAQVRAQLDAQQAEMSSLQGENTGLRKDRDQLRAERAKLAAEKAELNDRYADLAESASTVYYIAATKDQLKELGVVKEVGGARTITFRKRGQTLVPAANLNPADFTALSVKGNTEIALPKTNKSYRLVSNHDAALLSPLNKDSSLTGTVRITDPKTFWAGSKFLILVEK